MTTDFQIVLKLGPKRGSLANPHIKNKKNKKITVKKKQKK